MFIIGLTKILSTLLMGTVLAPLHAEAAQEAWQTAPVATLQTARVDLVKTAMENSQSMVVDSLQELLDQVSHTARGRMSLGRIKELLMVVQANVTVFLKRAKLVQRSSLVVAGFLFFSTLQEAARRADHLAD